MSSTEPPPVTTPPDPFYRLGEHFAIDLPGARAVFTTRRGGVSRGPFASLNLGRRTADEPGAAERNRQVLASELGVRLGFVRQVHGAAVCELANIALAPAADAHTLAPAADAHTVAPAADAHTVAPAADGLYTVEPGLAPTVLTADCLPIAIAGDGAVAMVHGGWRGLEQGIIAAGVRALREAGATGPLTAAIGPGAGPCCYEVSTDVHDAFATHPDHVHRGRNLDLAAIARYQLEQAGVEEVHDIGICTICSDQSLLFSHRRDRGVTGRQAGIAWLTRDG